MSRREAHRPLALGLFLIIAGLIGWVAAFALTVEKFHLLESPQAVLSCDFSVLVQCGANLASWQGAVFGFPNPILGLTGWVAPLVVGAALLAGARLDRWFWLLFNAGVAAAFVFVIWLISQSIFVLGTLCPWCMVTWAVTIPLFWAVTLRNLAVGAIPAPLRIRKTARTLNGWIVIITFASYVVIAVIAQVRLDVLATL